MSAAKRSTWSLLAALAALAAPLGAAQASPEASLGPPLPPAQLATARGTGGTEPVLNPISTTIGGAVGGNSAAGLATGNNVIQTGSFADASGMPVVIQNSGANVLIQNATVIHLELR